PESRRCERRAIAEQGADRQTACIYVAAQCQRSARITLKDLRDIAETFTNERNRVTATNYAFTRVAEDAMQESVLEVRAPGYAAAGREVLPIRIVEFLANGQWR